MSDDHTTVCALMAAGMERAEAEAIACTLEESAGLCATKADVEAEMKKAAKDVKTRLGAATVLLFLTVAIVGTGLAAVVLESFSSPAAP